MKSFWIVLLIIFFLTLSSPKVLANTSNSFNTEQKLFALAVVPLENNDNSVNGTGSDTNQVINSIIASFKMLDTLTGGIVFSTPAIFDKTFSLSDGAIITGFENFRFAFTGIGILIGAFVLLWKSSKSALTFQLSYLKSVGQRILIFALALLGVPLFLNYSLQATNAFNQTILPQHESLTSFIQDYYIDVGKQVDSGTSPDNFWISSTGFMDIFNNFTRGVLGLLFFAVSIISLVFGMLFIIFQFALRFLILVFLSIIYPLVLPFLLTEETEGIFYSFLRVWFTTLIHQPAFILGYALVLYIVRSLLLADQASIGLFFIYIASLFFLGTVNVLASRIFADAFVALGTNFEAAVATRTVSASLQRGFAIGKDQWSKWKQSKTEVTEDSPQKRGRQPHDGNKSGDQNNRYQKRGYQPYNDKRYSRDNKRAYIR